MYGHIMKHWCERLQPAWYGAAIGRISDSMPVPRMSVPWWTCSKILLRTKGCVIKSWCRIRRCSMVSKIFPEVGTRLETDRNERDDIYRKMAWRIIPFLM